MTCWITKLRRSCGGCSYPRGPTERSRRFVGWTGRQRSAKIANAPARMGGGSSSHLSRLPPQSCIKTAAGDPARCALFAPEECLAHPGARTCGASGTGGHCGLQPSAGRHIARRSAGRLAPAPFSPALETPALDYSPGLGTVCTTYHRSRCREKRSTSCSAAPSIRPSRGASRDSPLAPSPCDWYSRTRNTKTGPCHGVEVAPTGQRAAKRFLPRQKDLGRMPRTEAASAVDARTNRCCWGNEIVLLE